MKRLLPSHPLLPSHWFLKAVCLAIPGHPDHPPLPSHRFLKAVCLGSRYVAAAVLIAPFIDAGPSYKFLVCVRTCSLLAGSDLGHL